MQPLLRVLGYGLLLALFVWIAVYATRGGLTREPPQVHGTTQGVEGAFAVPNEKVDAVFAGARQRMVKYNSIGNVFHAFSQIASWVSFLATSAITLFAGYYGFSPDAGVATEQLLKQLQAQSSKITRIVGIMAAAAAIGTAVANRADAAASENYKNADKIQVAIRDARAKISSAKDAAAAQGALDELENLSIR